MSPRSLPCGGDPRRAWSRSSPVPLAGHGRSNTGSPRFLENPSRTFAPLFDSGRSDEPHPIGPPGAVPTHLKSEDTRMCPSRSSITRLWYLLPTLHEVRYRTPCKAYFRLVVNLYREGVEPSGFHRKVSVHSIHFLLSQAYPGATSVGVREYHAYRARASDSGAAHSEDSGARAGALRMPPPPISSRSGYKKAWFLASSLSDQSHLCRIFRRTFGQSPGGRRRANAFDLPLIRCADRSDR